jgi:hypothetical protein
LIWAVSTAPSQLLPYPACRESINFQTVTLREEGAGSCGD